MPLARYIFIKRRRNERTLRGELMDKIVEIPNEKGRFVPPDGMILSEYGYLKLPNGHLYYYRKDSDSIFTFLPVVETEIFVDEFVMPMFLVV